MYKLFALVYCITGFVTTSLILFLFVWNMSISVKNSGTVPSIFNT